jgi:predicted O-methyltransferase YrrM
MILIDYIHNCAEKVKGFLAPEEGQRLYALALEAAAVGPCLEIGSYCGKSAVYLGYACKERGSTLFSIDHHHGSEEQQPGEQYFDPELFDAGLFRIDTFGQFRKTLQMAELEETVVPMVTDSVAAARHWDTPLSLVFIDGGHAYDTVLSDYQCWSIHLKPNGYLLFHDIYPNPDDGGQAPYEVYQMALDSGHYMALPMTGSLGVLRRVSA